MKNKRNLGIASGPPSPDPGSLRGNIGSDRIGHRTCLHIRAMGWLDGDPTIKLGRIALLVESERLKIIGSNLANAQVPRFHALKCDFKKALQQNIKSEVSDVKIVATDPRHFGATDGSKGVRLPAEEERVSLRVDGNTVDVERELAELSKLQVRYRASLSAIAHRIRLIKLAMEKPL